MTIEHKTTYVSTNGSEFETWDEAYDYDKAWEIANKICYNEKFLDDYITMVRELLVHYSVWER